MEDMAHTKEELAYLQSMSLDSKIEFTKRRIRGWYESWLKYEIYNTNTGQYRYVTGREGELPKLRKGETCDPFDAEMGQVYVSFSGGKDSTVLLHIARQVYPDIEAVFVNTGLEYPEIQQFVKTFDNVTILRSKMRFDEVIKKYGYPIISKEVSLAIYYARKGSKWANNYFEGLDKKGKPHSFKKSMYEKYKPLTKTDFVCSDKCCRFMKEKPIDDYANEAGKKPITAIMASESKKRETAWLRVGCNAFYGKKPISKPMSFWTEQDVLQYIKRYNIPICSVYGDVVYEDDSEQLRFGDLGVDCLGDGRLTTTGCNRTGCVFCGFGCHLEKEPSRFQRLKVTHPKQYEYCIGGGEYDENGIWKPNKQGLGLGHVFDELNKIYGDGFIKYR